MYLGGRKKTTNYDTFLSRHAAVGSVLTQVEKNAHAYLFDALALIPIVNIFEIYTFCGSNIAGLMVKARSGGGLPTTLSQPVSNPITYADYSPTIGINGQGVRYLKTGVPNNYINSIGFGFYTPDTVNPATNPGCPMGAISTTSAKCIFEFKTTPSLVVTHRGQDLTLAYSSLGPGLYQSYSYSSTSNFYLLQNGAPAALSFKSAGSDDGSEFCIGSADGGLLPWNGNIGFAYIDNGRGTQAEYTAFSNVVSQFLFLLGRNPRSITNSNYVPITGQSLANGSLATPVLSTTQSYSNKMARGGVRQPIDQGALVPLIENTQETIASTVANSIAYWKRIITPGSDAHDLIMGNFALDGAAYTALKVGTAPFTNSITGAYNVAQTSNYYYKNRIKIPGVLVVHGEADSASAIYGTDCRAWQSDYDANLRGLSPQSPTIPLFHTQISSWTKLGSTTSVSPYVLYDEFKTNPTKTILVGAKYFLTHAADGLHLTNASERRLGEEYAKALFYLMEYGLYWKPVYPTLVSRTGAVITLTFNLPPLDLTLGSGVSTNSLSLDTTLVSNPGNYGFEFYVGTGGNSPTISSVTVTSVNTVEITLSATPTGTGCKIRYGYTGVLNNSAGPTTGPRGNLRDNQTTPSLLGNTIYNWCVHFDESVN